MPESLTGRYAEVWDTRTYYETIGDESDTSIVLLHTAGSEGRQWQYAAPELAAAGYHVVVPDMPGHGKSYPVDWEPISALHDYGEFVWELASVLELGEFAVAGCSIGGSIVIDMAVNHGDDLLGVVAFEGLAKTDSAALGRLSHPHACPGWQDILDYSTVDATHSGLDPARREELKWQHRGSQRVATNDLQASHDHDVLADAEQATCPTLVVRGTDDFYIAEELFDQTVDAIPDCESAVMAETGHYPMMERPSETVELIVDFLQ
ncbi:alpha/beta hydrolase [Halorubellus sp. JP-L1]|uniref:alpha/beta fold hydrolase n=1 Tax=Halorubellus sp. JP-L1 TaxID=2715753 RepID=UPI00140CE9EB|nr:alpha/beta hydrolase [Halorubellus sp. JP-L1]NHN42803.1 alpha/beta hydrolase [Halorubellus sp. JP-L1]